MTATRYTEKTDGGHIFNLNHINKMKAELQRGCKFYFVETDEDHKPIAYGHIIDFDGRFYHDPDKDIYHYHVTNSERKSILAQLDRQHP